MDHPRTYLQSHELLDNETDRVSRQRLLEEVLTSVEVILLADGAAFWREEPDHTLTLAASRSLPDHVVEALDRHVVAPLQSIMQRWPESPLVAVPLNDPDNPIAEEIRQIVSEEEIVGLAGVPCRVPGEILGMLVVVHRHPHSWTVRDLGLATGLAGQLATATQNDRLFRSVRTLASRLAGIHELSLRLAQLRDPETIAETIVGEVSRLVECDAARLYRPDADGALRPVAVCGTFEGIESSPLEALARSGETLPAWVAKRNEPLIVPDAARERRSIFRSVSGPESLLLVPLAYAEEVEGVLVVSKAGANRYGRDDEQALSVLARYAAQEFVNARNIARLERQQGQLEWQLAAERRLLEISEELVSTLDPRRVLEQIADTIGGVVSYDRLTIYRYDKQTAGIEPVVSRPELPEGPDGRGAAGGACQVFEEGLTGWVIGRGDAVCANDVGGGGLTGGELPEDAFGARRPSNRDRTGEGAAAVSAAESSAAETIDNIIVVPLRVHGEVVGSLNLIRVGGQEAAFSEHEFEIGKLFASQASLALQNAETHETVATRADLDALTGLRNHGTFQRDLGDLIDTGDVFALLMLDLDYFKSFNDTNGHPAGDTLLTVVAGALVGVIRQNDRAYRYGGDEFALLLRGASSRQAHEVAARVRAAVRSAVEKSAVGNGEVVVTASVGCACWPEDGREKPQLVQMADDALYRAKRLRNGQPKLSGVS